jgi:hypothetical protein
VTNKGKTENARWDVRQAELTGKSRAQTWTKPRNSLCILCLQQP